MRVNPVWKRIFLFLLSLTFVVLSGFSTPSLATDSGFQVKADLPDYDMNHTKYGQVGFVLEAGQSGNFTWSNAPYGVAVFMSEMGWSKSSVWDFQQSDAIFASHDANGTMPFPTKRALGRLAQYKEPLSLAITLVPFKSDGNTVEMNGRRVGTQVHYFPGNNQKFQPDQIDKSSQEILAEASRLINDSVRGINYGGKITGEYLKYLFDITEVLSDVVLPVGLGSTRCLGVSLNPNDSGIHNPDYVSCSAIIPYGGLIKQGGRLFKVLDVVIEDGTRLQRLVRVTEDVAKLSGKFRNAEEVADFAVKSEKAATLAWLKEGEQGVEVYYGMDRITAKTTYIGITKNLAQRKLQHLADERTFDVVKIGNLPDLTLHEARSIEQFYINEKGLKKLEGELENKINSISPSRDISKGAQEFARTAVKVFDLPDL